MSDVIQTQIGAYIQQDPYAKFLGAEIEQIEPGYSRVTLTITPQMVNFHGMTHGGILFSLGDIAFAAASNSRGQKAVALDVNIIFLAATKPGDRLIAEAIEQHQSGRTALYDITVKDQEGQLIAKSQNLVYRKREWFIAGAEPQ